MKPSRHKKVIGLSIGEQTLQIAEVLGGERPEVRHLSELVYPPGLTLDRPADLGKVLQQLLRDKHISAQHAVVGLPAKWMVARSKELPAADRATRASILRLEAEAEFSSELKDLVFDYVAERGETAGAGSSVLLMATPQHYLDAARELCVASKLNLIAVMPSAVALGEATARGTLANSPLVLAVGASGSELTAQRGSTPSAVRHLRSSISQPMFVSELRRAVSMMPAANRRELVLWDGSGVDSAALGTQIGLSVRSADLSNLGVAASEPSRNGAGRAYAAAVALALTGLRDDEFTIDFLHSRLAPVKTRRIPRWVGLAGLAAVMLIGALVWGYLDLQQRQGNLNQLLTRFDGMKSSLSEAETFVARVSFAQAWHGGEPRYLACVRDLTLAIPDDGQTFATSLIVRETPKLQGTNNATAAGSGAAASVSVSARRVEVRSLSGQVYGKTADQQHVQIMLDRMKQNAAFTNVKLGGTQDAGRGREVSFSITFDYLPPTSAGSVEPKPTP